MRPIFDKLNTSTNIIRKGQDKAKPNPFEEISEKDKEFMNTVVSTKTEELHRRLYELKQKQLQKKGITYEDFSAKLISKPLSNIQDLIDMGCIDGYGNAEEHKDAMRHGENSAYEMLIPKSNMHHFEQKMASEFTLHNFLTQRFQPS